MKDSSTKAGTGAPLSTGTSTGLSTGIKQVLVPDIGNFKDVNVIEVLVKAGDTINAEDSLITLETDKAAIDIPSPFAGVVKEIKVKPGDKVSQGALIALIEAGGETAVSVPTPATSAPEPATAPEPAAIVAPDLKPAAPAPQQGAAPAAPDFVQATSTPPTAPIATASPALTPPFAKGGLGLPDGQAGGISAHASPSIRRLARELGVNLMQVRGSGEKGRVTSEDVQNFVKAILEQREGEDEASGHPLAHPLSAQPRSTACSTGNVPETNFARFGAVESKPLSRISKLSGANLLCNWVSIPHVTQFDEADITEMEAFRKQLGVEYAAQGIRITLLAFLLKAVMEALQQFPDFNASLDASGENLLLKKYFHIGVAVDTPDGLVVPVLRDVNQKGIVQLARELAEIAGRARDRKITAAEMQGGCFTISSLGSIGGTAFTPIINAPEVAILGVSRSSMKPVYQNGEFVPRLMLPLSLSYDHRVIDGAAAAHFTVYLAQTLADIRRLAL